MRVQRLPCELRCRHSIGKFRFRSVHTILYRLKEEWVVDRHRNNFIREHLLSIRTWLRQNAKPWVWRNSGLVYSLSTWHEAETTPSILKGAHAIASWVCLACFPEYKEESVCFSKVRFTDVCLRPLKVHVVATSNISVNTFIRKPVAFVTPFKFIVYIVFPFLFEGIRVFFPIEYILDILQLLRILSSSPLVVAQIVTLL